MGSHTGKWRVNRWWAIERPKSCSKTTETARKAGNKTQAPWKLWNPPIFEEIPQESLVLCSAGSLLWVGNGNAWSRFTHDIRKLHNFDFLSSGRLKSLRRPQYSRLYELQYDFGPSIFQHRHGTTILGRAAFLIIEQWRKASTHQIGWIFWGGVGGHFIQKIICRVFLMFFVCFF